MFGKQLKVQGSIRLKGKDLEEFKSNLKKQFDSFTIQKMFDDNDECLQEKLVGSKMIIYHLDEYPAFVDGTGKNEFVPSLYSVSEYPGLVGTLILKDGVELKAKVLWSQVTNSDKLGMFKKDSIKKILSHDKKLLAIGAIGCDSCDLEQEKAKGVAAYILHKVGDQLWAHGSQEMVPAREQEDYDKIQEIHTQDYEVLSDEDLDLAMITQGIKQKKGTKKQVQKQPQPKVQQQPQAQQFEEDSDQEENQKNKKNSKKAKQKPQQNEEDLKVPLKVMDQYIKEAFLNALKIGVTDKQLPIEGQQFYEKQMQQFKRENIELDIKNSNYQKVGKFLQQMAKDGIIEFKEVKKGQPQMITKIDRSNDILDDWEPTVVKATNKKAQDFQEQGEKQQYKPMVEIIELYLPQGPILPMFENEEKQVQPLTREQFVSQQNKFLKANCQLEKKLFQMNWFLLQLGLGQESSDDEDEDQDQEQEQQEEGVKVKKQIQAFSVEDIQKKVESFMIKKHQIKNLLTKQVEFKNYEFKGLQLIAEKLHKIPVNRIVGLETFGFDCTLKAEDIYSFQYLAKQLTDKFNFQVQIHDVTGEKVKKEKPQQKQQQDQQDQKDQKEQKHDKKQKQDKKAQQQKKGKKEKVVEEKEKEQEDSESEEEITDEQQQEQQDKQQQLQGQQDKSQQLQGQQDKQQQLQGQQDIKDKALKQVEKELIIQGNVIEDLQEYFVNVVKIDSKYIKVSNKLAIKKKPQPVMR